MAKEPKDDKDPLHFDELAKRLDEIVDEDDEPASSKTDIYPETIEDKTKEPEERRDDDEGVAPKD